MTSNDPQQLYDEYYFATGCGLPYRRDEHWTSFFAGIAEAIVQTIAPRRVLDAGCALGLLVEQLRERGVEADGIDISEYAIANAPESIQPFVRVGSIAEPFYQRYDLIVCIEVVEHMPSAEAERAIANFCTHSDDVLFSSSPLDFKETTHINVHPIEYWAELFAYHGFVRDVDYDASFLTPWAVRFRRRTDPLPRVIRDYERRFWELWKANTDLRALSQEQREHMRGLEAHAHNLTTLREQAERELACVREQAAHVREQAAHEVQRVAEQAHQTLHHERTLFAQQLAIAVRERHLVEMRAQLDRAAFDEPPITSAYLAQLHEELAAKTAHILELEDLLRRIGEGRVLRTLNQVNERLNQLRSQPRSLLPAPPSLPKLWRTPAPSAPHTPVTELRQAGDPVYARWIAAHEPDAEALAAQRQAVAQWADRPLISLLTPVYNPPLPALSALLASVRAQTYDRWELCLADASTDPAVRGLLAAAAAGEPRIKLVHLSANHGISANTNAALALASGELVLVLDHDDCLTPDALYEIATLLQRHPDAEVIYYDEDKLSEDGNWRHSPWFKPAGFSPDLLLATNYLMHAAFRRTLVQRLGGFDPATDGAQDWDLALRCSEQTRAIYHLPRVLYHWRQVPGSAARDANAKPWALAGQEQALRGHLQRTGNQAAQVVRLSPSDLRVVWPTSGQLVSIIIPNRDQPALLRACLTSIRNQTDYPAYEIVIVDNRSRDPATLAYYAELQHDPQVQIIPFDEPFNWSRANNLGAAAARGNLLLFLNNDTEVRSADWLRELAGWAERPEVGVVGCRLVRPDGTTQHAGIVLGVEGHGSHVFDGQPTPAYGPFGSSEWYRNLMAVTGACLMTRREVFAALGGFDERYRVGYSDITFCVQAHQRGLRVIYTPHTTLLHHEGASRGLNLPAADVLRGTLELLPLMMAGDPYFSPNLSPVHRWPMVADPAGETRAERIATIMRMFHLSELPSAEAITALAPQLAAFQQRRPLVADAPRRILCASHELSLSGAPLMLFQLARQLQARGDLITFAAPAQGPLGPAVEAAGLNLVIVPGLYSDALAAAALVQRYDLVIVNTVLGWRAVLAAHAADVPCAWWIHESRYGQELITREPAAREALNVAAALIFPAQATALLYAPLMSRTLPAPIPYGVATPSQPATAFPRNPHRIQIAVMASLEPRKGQDVLFAALQRMPVALRNQIDLYLVGGMLDKSFYRDLRQQQDPQTQIYYTGLLSHAEALNYLMLADIFVLPSRDEVLPVAMLEAMALGKAILITDVGGVREALRHGEEAMIVPPGNAEALAQDLTALVASPALRARLGAAARARYEAQFTAEQFAATLTELLDGLIQRSLVMQDANEH